MRCPQNGQNAQPFVYSNMVVIHVLLPCYRMLFSIYWQRASKETIHSAGYKLCCMG